MYLAHRDRKQPGGDFWPLEIGPADECEQVLPVGTLRVWAGAAVDPAFQHFGHVEDEPLNLFLNARRIVAIKDRK